MVPTTILFPVTESRRMYEAMKRIGAEVLYTEYPGGTHASWEEPTTNQDYFPGYSPSLSGNRQKLLRPVPIHKAKFGWQATDDFRCRSWLSRRSGSGLLYGRWLSVEATWKQRGSRTCS